MRPALMAAAAAFLLWTGQASAQAQYKASDIIDHFSGGSTAAAEPTETLCNGKPCLAKKDTRTVCIGTASACQAAEAPAPVGEAAAPAGFDLLITFELGSDRLTATAQQNLTEFANALKDPALVSARFRIEGHTDASGSAELNKALSERRAASVVSFLTGLGIESGRLEPVGFGEDNLRNTADPNAAINRRVEASLIVN